MNLFKYILFFICAFLSTGAFAQISQTCPACPPPITNSTPNGAAVTVDSAHKKLVYSVISSSGGTVTSFSAGNLSGFATTSVSNPTSTPNLTFSLGNASAHTFWGDSTGSAGAPGYFHLSIGDLPTGIPNANLANSTISGISLGSNLIPLVNGFGVASLSYNGSAGTSVIIDSTKVIPWNDTSQVIASQHYVNVNKGTGTVTQVTSGNFSPLFTVGVATNTTTPAFTFTPSNAASRTILANTGSASGAYAFVHDSLAGGSLHLNEGTATQVLHGNAAGAPSWSAVALTTDITGILPVSNGGTGNSTSPLGPVVLDSLSTTGGTISPAVNTFQVLTASGGALTSFTCALPSAVNGNWIVLTFDCAPGVTITFTGAANQIKQTAFGNTKILQYDGSFWR